MMRPVLVALMIAMATIPPAGSSAEAETEGKIARVGRLYTGSPATMPRGFAEFSERLRELGWIEGRNLVTESRWAEGHEERYPALVRDLLERRVDVMVVTGTAAAVAAKRATSLVPIVAVGMGDPVASGLVHTLARPGGNLTGFSVQNTEGMPGKWLELLKETVPGLTNVAVILGPTNPLAPVLTERLDQAALAQGLTVRSLSVDREDGLDKVFRQVSGQAQAAVVLPETFTMYHRKRIAALAARYRVPTLYGLLDFADVGGLMAYGVDNTALYRGAAVYVDKILRGARPADLPVEQPTTFSLVINLKAAKRLGLTIPESILLRADEVIR